MCWQKKKLINIAWAFLSILKKSLHYPFIEESIKRIFEMTGQVIIRSSWFFLSFHATQRVYMYSTLCLEWSMGKENSLSSSVASDYAASLFDSDQSPFQLQITASVHELTLAAGNVGSAIVAQMARSGSARTDAVFVAERGFSLTPHFWWRWPSLKRSWRCRWKSVWPLPPCPRRSLPAKTFHGNSRCGQSATIYLPFLNIFIKQWGIYQLRNAWGGKNSPQSEWRKRLTIMAVWSKQGHALYQLVKL